MLAVFEGAVTSTAPLLMQPRTRVRGSDQPLGAASGSATTSSPRTSSGSTCTYGGTAPARPIATNLRLPGQYDERLLGSLGLQGPYYNWNRWYLPGVGRYLGPDPEGFKGKVSPRSDTGEEAPHWYTYAEGNPLRFTDTEGLFTQDEECKNYPKEADVSNYIEGAITDDCLKQCMLRQVSAAHLDCKTLKDYCKSHPGIAGKGPIADNCGDPTHTVFWCSLNISKSCRVQALVHELAHTCGWHHYQDKGVPGNTGTLRCKPD